MKKMQLRLSNGLSALIEVANYCSEEMVTNEMSNGQWFTDEYGWKINPQHVVCLREDEDD